MNAADKTNKKAFNKSDIDPEALRIHKEFNTELEKLYLEYIDEIDKLKTEHKNKLQEIVHRPYKPQGGKNE